MRQVADLEPVLPSGHGLPQSLVAYRMYRGVCREGDEPLFPEGGVRYDLTVLLPRWDLPEAVKTFGHHHPVCPGAGLTYPEVYQVVAGRALFLLQSEAEVAVLSASAGEVVWVPPGFAHVTANPGPSRLVIANLVADGFESLYSEFAEKGGAAYRLVAKAGSGDQLEAEPNSRYHPLPPLRRLPPAQWNRHRGPREWPSAGPGGRLDPCIYRAFVRDPDAFQCLLHPREGW